MADEPVTVRELASLLRISKSTVARALSGDHRVAEATRDRVLNAARELEYRPLPSIRRAMHDIRRARPPARHHRLLWWSIWNSDFSVERQAFEQARQSAGAMGYDLMRLEGETSFEKVQKRARHWNAEGIVTFFRDSGVIRHEQENLKWKIPVVAVMRAPISTLSLPQVSVQPVSVMRQAVYQCFAAGYKRMGLVINPLFDDPDFEYAGVWQALVAEFNLPVTHSTLAAQTSKDYFLKWIQNERIDCLISFHESAYNFLIEAGFSLPEAFGYLHLRASTWQSVHRPAEIDDRIGALARLAVSRIIGLVEHAIGWDIERESMATLLADWTPGDTIRETGNNKNLRCRNFAESRQASDLECFPVDLSHVVNRSFEGDSAWFGAEPLRGMTPGLHRLSGIPFYIENEGEDAQFLLLQSEGSNAKGEQMPVEVAIPVERRCHEVVMLHACAWIGESNAFAEYEIHYRQGKSIRIPVRAPRRLTLTREDEVAIEEYVVHDWYYRASTMENATTKPVWVCNARRAMINGHLYMHCWKNPHPRRNIQSINIRSFPERQGAFGVIAMTLRGVRS